MCAFTPCLYSFTYHVARTHATRIHAPARYKPTYAHARVYFDLLLAQQTTQKGELLIGQSVRPFPISRLSLHAFLWSKHVQSTTGKASKVLGMMKRNLWNCPKRVRETAYTAIVRPKLEYASSAWDPYHQKDIDSLERVQRKAARFCCNNYQPTASVTAMIQDLGWKTLESRRTMTRLTLLYKMSRGEIDIDTDSFLRPHAESRTRASHSYRYRQDKATKNLYFYSFFPRTLRQWNNLPADIVESNSLSQFQSKLSDHLSHV